MNDPGSVVPRPCQCAEAQGVSSAALLGFVNALDQQIEIEGLHSEGMSKVNV